MVVTQTRMALSSSWKPGSTGSTSTNSSVENYIGTLDCGAAGRKNGESTSLS